MSTEIHVDEEKDKKEADRDPEYESGSSSSCEDEQDLTPYIPMKDRPEWSDVKPLKQIEPTGVPIVRILYSQRFTDVYDYFRAIYQSQEVSERAFQLCGEAVTLNPANYTVWQHRRKLLFALNRDLREELTFIRRVIEENPKNYQVWHHRKTIVEKLNDCSAEFKFVEIVLSGDAKNYHAWQHRQWVITHFSVFHFESDFIHYSILNDIRNNSAWNHKYFVLVQKSQGKISEETFLEEIDFTFDALSKVCANESAWNYLRGLSDLLRDEYPHVLKSVQDRIRDFCDKKLKSENLHSTVERFVLAALVELCVDEINEKEDVDGSIIIESQTEEKLTKMCDRLANHVDKIRKQYWTYVKKSTLNKQKAV